MGRTSPWWVVSTVLHVAALLALLWFTPLRRIVLQPGQESKFETTASPDRIEEVVAQVRDLQAQEVAFQVEELLDIREAMEDLRDAKLEDLGQFAAELAEDAPREVLAAQDKALAAQQRALEALDGARQAQDRTRTAQAEAQKALPAQDAPRAAAQNAAAEQAQDQAKQAHRTAREAQVAADEAQTEADDMLAMMGPHAKAARAAQAEAAARQAAAAGAEIAAQSAQDEARSRQRQAAARLAGLAEREQKVRQAATEVPQAEAKVKELTPPAEEAREKGRQAADAHAAAKTEAAKAQRAIRQVKAQEAKQQAEAAFKMAEKQEEELRKENEAAKAAAKAADDKLRAVQNDLNRAQRELQSAQTQLQKAREEAQRAHDEAATAHKQADGATQTARQAQEIAKAAQETARQAAEKAIREAPAIASQPAQDLPDPRRAERPGLMRMSVADLYDVAVQAETQNTQAYKQLRAADLAMIRKVPLEKALEQTDVVRPIRPELDKQLLTGSVRDMETADRHKKEVEKAVREIQSMVTLGRRMVDLAQAAQAEADGAMLAADWYRAKAAQAEELQQAALEDDSARAKDLSALMAAAEGDGPGSQAQRRGEGQGQASATGMRGAGAGREGRAGGRPGSGGPPTVPRDLKPIPGRMVTSGGLPSKWMFVDSWYVIGPFANPGRINRDKKFPPESVVDLDARYEGKDGRVIRWEFLQSAETMIVPADPEEYAIYYAYAELWFERPMDLWVAVGSDDKSSLWVEDQPVWVSGDQLKRWSVAEGMRRVHFKQGRNRILYRIENGWRQVAWSLLIHTEP